ncbi:MAG: PKD domain-containing protein [bacterium]|nr:PKD domain-containing protein [bacterium]
MVTQRRPFAALSGSASLILALGLAVMIGSGCRSQNSGDTPGMTASTVTASFSQDVTGGMPGLIVTFTDTSAGDITDYSWDFGNGDISSAQNPQTTYPNAGIYSVSLTVAGTGGTSTLVMTDLIEVAGLPTAGFDCLPEIGFAPLTVDCMSQFGFGVNVSWDFGDGTVSSEANPTHVFDTPDLYAVQQTVSNASGVDVAMANIEVLPLSISALPGSGALPGTILFSADVGGAAGLLETWFVDGSIAGSGRDEMIPMRRPGIHTVEYVFAGQAIGLIGTTSMEFVVSYGPISAGFSPSAVEGAGPLSVTMNDESLGDVTQWEWDFGDGTNCVFPEPVGGVPTGSVLCDASSPTHVYGAVGRYDVNLTVTGRTVEGGAANSVDTLLLTDAVTVTILDPSFENQVTGGEIAAGWTALRPAGALQAAQHIALSDLGVVDGDAGMPTEGNKWAALDGLGTDGSTPAPLVENGIEQAFLRPATDTVLEFDFALLFSEPPVLGLMDALTATVSDGTTTVEMPSAVADILSAYAGPSSRYPTLDGSLTRVTPVHSASLDLATAFPGAPADTLYTLTIRLTNATNGFRSPRAYIDNIRFSPPAAAFAANFSISPIPVVAGEPTQFTSGICPAVWDRAAALPMTYRWDFDFQVSAIPPEATGSNEQCPIYTFPVAGPYDVTLLARDSDKESLASLLIVVIESPEASFAAHFPDPDIFSVEVPVTLSFRDPLVEEDRTIKLENTSVSDPSDAITDWSWDFGGFGTSNLETPADIVIPFPGPLLIRLTVTTVSGLTDTGTLNIIVD